MIAGLGVVSNLENVIAILTFSLLLLVLEKKKITGVKKNN